MCTRELRIGFAFDRESGLAQSVAIRSVEAEYEDSRTIDWIRGTLSRLGTVVDLPWGHDTVRKLAYVDLDVIFNITEAHGGRNRESLVPAVAESLGIPYTGSDAVSLGVSLDKYLTKVVAQHEGVPTPRFLRVDSLFSWEKLVPRIRALDFPVIAKPNTGGSSMGIRRSSKAHSLAELYEEVKWILNDCGDSVLVEEFVPGTDVTFGLLRRERLMGLPAAEVRIDNGGPEGFYSFEMKSEHRKQIICPADLPESVAMTLERHSRAVFHALGCRDMARVDFRLMPSGEVLFLEINPLPGLSPHYSIFPAQAAAMDIAAEDIIDQLVTNALEDRAALTVPQQENSCEAQMTGPGR